MIASIDALCAYPPTTLSSLHRTEKGAGRIVAKAASMTFDAAEQLRKDRPRKGGGASTKHALDALAELGLTHIVGVALPDTRNLTSEQAVKVLDVIWAIREATLTGGAGLSKFIQAISALVKEYAAAPAPSQPPADSSESS